MVVPCGHTGVVMAVFRYYKCEGCKAAVCNRPMYVRSALRAAKIIFSLKSALVDLYESGNRQRQEQGPELP